MSSNHRRYKIIDPLESCPPGLTPRVVKRSGILEDVQAARGDPSPGRSSSRGYRAAGLITAVSLVAVVYLGEANPDSYLHLGKNSVALANQLMDSFRMLPVF